MCNKLIFARVCVTYTLHPLCVCMGVLTLQHSATHTVSHCNKLHLALGTCMYGCIHTATHCNTHCISLQQTTPCTLYVHVWVYSHCNTLQHTLHLTTTHGTLHSVHACMGVLTLQHTATHTASRCNTLHMALYACMYGCRLFVVGRIHQNKTRLDII